VTRAAQAGKGAARAATGFAFGGVFRGRRRRRGQRWFPVADAFFVLPYLTVNKTPSNKTHFGQNQPETLQFDWFSTRQAGQKRAKIDLGGGLIDEHLRYVKIRLRCLFGGLLLWSSLCASGEKTIVRRSSAGSPVN
jgi:hypothetical protein